MSPSRRHWWMGLKSWQAGHRTWRIDKRDNRVRPTLTLLEERTLLSTLNLTVTTLADDPVTPISGQTTLRDAITQGNASTDSQEVINFAPGLQGTIDLAIALPGLANNISIEGPGVSNLTVQGDFTSTSHVFTGVDKHIIGISGMTISNGSGDDIFSSGTLTVNNCVFANTSTRGIINYTGAVTVTNCIFNTKAGGNGGGIYSYAGPVTVTNCTLTGNSSVQGASGIWNDTSGVMTVTNCTISGYNSQGNGGGIFNVGTMTVDQQHHKRQH